MPEEKSSAHVPSQAPHHFDTPHPPGFDAMESPAGFPLLRVLAPSDLPGADAPWDEVMRFALSFDGYGYWGSFERAAHIANEVVVVAFREGREGNFHLSSSAQPCSSSSDAGAIFGEEPRGEAFDYMHQLVEEIRRRVGAAEPACNPGPR